MYSTGVKLVQVFPSGLPQTSTVNSRPSIYSSTKAEPNSFNIFLTFIVKSAILFALEALSTPRLSPALAGFTKSGKFKLPGSNGRSPSDSTKICAGVFTSSQKAKYFMMVLDGSYKFAVGPVYGSSNKSKLIITSIDGTFHSK